MAGTGTQNLTGTVINANITAQGGILKINNSSLAYSGIITMAGGTLDFTSRHSGGKCRSEHERHRRIEKRSH